MSFEELTDKISSKLKGIAYQIHRTVPAFSAEDLYQEAVLNLWVDYQDGKLSNKTDSYVLQGCYFYLKNHVRASKEKTVLMSVNMPINDDGLELQSVLESAEDDASDQKPDIDSLMEDVFVNQLDRKEKEVAFFYLQGWTTREIGRRLGLSHVSVVNMESKIREKCRKLINCI
ncbi:MAG: sigma-70 family RNA polymerase sigma factor [Candidatus Omnitrophota bacterium]